LKYSKSYDKKTIVFLPTYDYLSEKLFLSFINKLDEFNTIYINNDEFQLIKKNKNIAYNFSYYLEVRGGYSFKKNKNILKKLKKIFIENKALQTKLLKNIKDINPDLVITTSDMSIAFKGIKKYCDKNNIPTILIQPSFFDYEETNKKDIKSKLRKLINIFLDIYPKQILWGNEDKNTILFLWGNFFKNYYNKEKDIRIVGNPIYDNYNDKCLSTRDKDNLRSNLKIMSNKKVVTICTEAFGGLISKEDTNMLFKFYSEIINTNQNFFFIIKLHPRDSIKDINLRLNINLSNYVLIGNEYSLLDIFYITDIQVSVASASSLEAILLNIPVILINPNNSININNFFNNSVELRAHDIIEFNKCLDMVSSVTWSNKFALNRDKFLSVYLNSLGSASSNIKKEIKRILHD
jgi:hypothetical protein